MFYCDPCAKNRGWPQSGFRSFGRCEMCQKRGDCNDVPSKFLPEESEVPKTNKLPENVPDSRFESDFEKIFGDFSKTAL